jgi:hypothetical protein
MGAYEIEKRTGSCLLAYLVVLIYSMLIQTSDIPQPVGDVVVLIYSMLIRNSDIPQPVGDVMLIYSMLIQTSDIPQPVGDVVVFIYRCPYAELRYSVTSR